MNRACALIVLIVLSQAQVVGQEAVEEKDLRKAIGKAMPLLEIASAGSAEHRKCFSCHGQAMPVLALTEARLHGFEIDESNLNRQLDHTASFLKRGRKSYLEGKGQGGRVDTAGYALWTLEAGERPADEMTRLVIDYVLNTDADKGRWKHSSNRPPSEASDFTTTYLALRAIAAFADAEQQPSADARTEAATKWLMENEPKDTEDRVFHLRALAYSDAGEKVTRRYADELIALQHDDGGWSQTGEMDSDPYATATVLVALSRSEQLDSGDQAFRRGLRFLLQTQRDDGSWHVVSRSDPFQKYFESGFPHGEDQFISTTASAWATIAMLLALPE